MKSKLKTKLIKNSYSKTKYNKEINKNKKLEMYINKLIDEVEDIPKNERLYYTMEELWKKVEEMEIKKFGHKI